MNSTSMRLWVGLFVLVVFVAGVAGGVALRPWVASDPHPEFSRRGLRRDSAAPLPVAVGGVLRVLRDRWPDVSSIGLRLTSV